MRRCVIAQATPGRDAATVEAGSAPGRRAEEAGWLLLVLLLYSSSYSSQCVVRSRRAASLRAVTGRADFCSCSRLPVRGWLRFLLLPSSWRLPARSLPLIILRTADALVVPRSAPRRMFNLLVGCIAASPSC